MLVKFTKYIRSIRIEHNVGWLILMRVFMLCGILLSSLSMLLKSADSFSQIIFIFSPIAGLLLFSALSATWLKYKAANNYFIYLQIIADSLIVSGTVYVTGAAFSPFLFLYLPVVMAASILLSQSAALIISTLNILSYLGLTLAIKMSWIMPADPASEIYISAQSLSLQVTGLLSAMILISVATSYLTRKLHESTALVEKSNSDLKNQNKLFNQALIEGIPEGIIVTEGLDQISSTNQVAATLLKSTTNDLIGKSLHQVLKKVDPKLGHNCFFSGNLSTQKELDIVDEVGENSQKYVFYGRPICNSNQQQVGCVYVFQNVTKLKSIEGQLQVQERMARLLAEQNQTPSNAPDKHNLVGNTAVMGKVFNLVERVAKTDTTVLITGESGTGKELIAKAIHNSSQRAKANFIAVNCSAIPENLIESELFGHKKGSFTSAHADHIGLFRQAEGGTIFLDEIGELPLALQSKLLRVIQEKSVRPVGADHDIPINVRILSATNRNLKDEICKGNFREDLFYRLNVISITLPPLRERKEDIPELIHSILKDLVAQGEKPIVSPEAMELLVKYNYPGNVRELENILERALVLGGNVILPEHLPDNLKTSEYKKFETTILVNEELTFPVNLENILNNLERKYLEAALIQTSGAKKRAADLLGINFRSFRYRLQKFDLDKS